MAVGAAMVANAFTGLYASSWNGWVYFAFLFGPVLIWAYTVRAMSTDMPIVQ